MQKFHVMSLNKCPVFLRGAVRPLNFAMMRMNWWVVCMLTAIF